MNCRTGARIHQLFLTFADYVVPAREPKICYSVPYQWSVIGIAFDTRFSDQFEANWGILLERPNSELGSIKLVSEDRLLMKTALVYLEGKLSIARALLNVEIESYNARRISPPERLQVAYRELDAFLKSDPRGKASGMAQLKSAIENLLHLSKNSVAKLLEASSVEEKSSRGVSSIRVDPSLPTLLDRLQGNLWYVLGSPAQSASREGDDIFAKLDEDNSDDAEKILSAARIATTESSSFRDLQPFTPEQTATLETYFKQGVPGFTAALPCSSEPVSLSERLIQAPPRV